MPYSQVAVLGAVDMTTVTGSLLAVLVLRHTSTLPSSSRTVYVGELKSTVTTEKINLMSRSSPQEKN